MTRVLVVATSAVVRTGLETVLSRAGLEVVTGHTGSIASHPAADVIVADADELPSADLPLVLLSDAPDTAATMRRGARAVLPRDAAEDEIVAAVHAAAAGLLTLRPEALGLVLPPATESIETLTSREIEILALLAEGLGNKMIAHRLGISEHTVKFHVGSILAKTGASTRTEAVTVGIRQGLIMV